MGRLDGRVGFITGGARGQGRAIAAKFASEGADIAICDVPTRSPNLAYETATQADLDATVQLIQSSGRRCIADIVDVRDQDGLSAFAQRVWDEYGRIDIVCANAGIVSWGPTLEMPEHIWQEVLDVNLTGIWKTVKATAPFLIRRGEGSIVITTSTNSVEPLRNIAAYVAAKHGALGLMRVFALELGDHGIRVNAVAPGLVATPMSDNPAVYRGTFGREDVTREEYIRAGHNWTALKGRNALSAADVADVVIWLASDESRHVTGIEINIDAGHMVLPGYNTSPIVDPDLPIRDYDVTALGHAPRVPGDTARND
jgi:SDR family mycofactocin-dependent oxidoreductase